MYSAYLAGLVVGATIGALIIGGLLGWAIHKATRLDYAIADGIGVLLLPIGIVLGNSSERLDPLTKWLAYGAAALIAYFILRLLRRWMQRPGRPKAGAE
ncbi:MAG: hypothetical protein ABS35_34645 [Kaistia sp. SCN 65-12]|nr:MAG: hypothetical protein ABS35_34645 [Kaistia sp. SCN 65-12]